MLLVPPPNGSYVYVTITLKTCMCTCGKNHIQVVAQNIIPKYTFL